MKVVFSIIIFSFSWCAFANKYLDSTETHPYLKLTSYPFLFPKGQNGGSFALGPSVSVSVEHWEIQIGILYDFTKYSTFYRPTHASPTSYIDFHKWYLPVGFINYYFRISNRINVFPSFGGGYLSSPEENASHRWVYAGVDVSYKASEKIKLNTTIHERNSSDGFSQGAFFEIAYRLK